MALPGAAEYVSSLSTGYQSAIVLLTANQLGVFNCLQSGPLSADQIATQLGLLPQPTEKLLNALCALGLLEKTDGQDFRNSALADEVLVHDSPNYQGDMLCHHAFVLDRWISLPSILQGKEISSESGACFADGLDRNAAFIRGMANIGAHSAKQLAESLDLRGVKRVLDLGGGPGVYLLAIMARCPESHGVLLDFAQPLTIAREFVAASGQQQRVSFVTGDMLDADFGDNFDLILLSNIIHSMTPEQIQQLFSKAQAALAEGGRLVIKDFFLNEHSTGPIFPALFAINMLVAGNGGSAYRYSEVAQWLTLTGLSVIQCCPLAQHSTVLVATK